MSLKPDSSHGPSRSDLRLPVRGLLVELGHGAKSWGGALKAREREEDLWLQMLVKKVSSGVRKTGGQELAHDSVSAGCWSNPSPVLILGLNEYSLDGDARRAPSTTPGPG